MQHQETTTHHQSRQRIKSSCKILKGLDLFGENINLTFKSAKTFNTSLGGLVSALCLILFFSFFIVRTEKFYSMEDPFFSMTILS